MDPKHFRILFAAIAGLAALSFITGWLLFSPAHSSAPAQFALPADPPSVLRVAPPDPVAPPPTHKYRITIETTADWSRTLLTDGATFTVDNAESPIELRSDTPQQVDHFLYAPTEVAINQKQFSDARIVVKCIVETSAPTVQVRFGHGSNGFITISSPVESFTNNQTLGDGTNFVVGAIRLE